MRILPLVSLVLSAGFSIAQKQPPPTPAKERLKGLEQRKMLAQNSLVSNIEFRSVGPTVMSGRVSDIEVNPADPTHFYVAYASGGLWKTANNGLSFTPVFDNEAVMTIGDIAVNWQTGTVWVGTGENNSSRSSYSGTGIYKSTDNGNTWKHSGLPETHHTGRIVLHPGEPNTLWVAAIGHLYSPNRERGVFKSTDGGKTWKQTLYIDENTGVIDLAVNPQNPDVLYAAAWHKQRRAWNFTESGEGSGIYKSTDGGETWKLLTVAGSGFPTGEGVGRIGLSIYPGKPGIIYAIVDNQNRREKEEKEEEKLTKDKLRAMSSEEFLKLDKQKLDKFLSGNNFPEKYTSEEVKNMVRDGKIKPAALAEYLEDENSLLFDTPVIGAEVYRTDDGGKTWKKTHDEQLDDVFFTYGYYFGQVRVSPHNPGHIYIVGVPILKSEDGGKTFNSINEKNVHVDHHALWINPSRKGHLITGNDGGVNISYDNGKHWFKANTPPVGQFYTVAVDMEKPYHVYGGLQDNGVWKGPSTYEASTSWHQSGKYPYEMVLWGDGMQVAIDARNNQTIYTGFQFGNYFRINTETGRRTSIKPKHELGERPLRYNWQTPIHLSVHNQDILYLGSNKFHRSMNKGETWNHTSKDLTQGGKKGDVSYGTLTAIHESPLKFGLIYAGSDDGLIHVTKDAGYTWARISDKLPKDFWVSRVQASSHDEGTVYASLNGYRWDNFTSYLYVSKNYGSQWERIGLDLPAEPVNVVKEDAKNPNILYVGTDHGVYVSMNKGRTFNRLSKGLPSAPVHDLVIHPRENDLVAGTHGRSIYIANVEHLQQLVDTILEKNIHIFAVKNIKHRKNWGKSWSKWLEPDEPEIQIPFYLKKAGSTTITITMDSLLLIELKDESERGLNYVKYNLSISEETAGKLEKHLNEKKNEEEKSIEIEKADNDKYYLPPGKYNVEIASESGIISKTGLLIEASKR